MSCVLHTAPLARKTDSQQQKGDIWLTMAELRRRKKSFTGTESSAPLLDADAESTAAVSAALDALVADGDIDASLASV